MSHTHNYIGYLGGVPQRRVYVDIEIRNPQRPKLSISGSAPGSWGQIDMHIWPGDITPAPHLMVEDIEKLWAIWKRWHLNDMQAGCEHQNNIARAEKYAPHVGDPCPKCGYRYGSAWLHEALPQDVIEWLASKFDIKDFRRAIS